MQKSIYIYTALIILTILSSCRKDGFEDILDLDRPEIQQITFVEARVQGLVVDINNQAISNAMIEWGESTTFTDDNGAFSLMSTVRNNHAALEISKDGYFDGHKVLQTFEEEVTEIKVRLVERTLTGTINSEMGGIVKTNQGGKIEFADGFQYADGSPYEGEVQVYAFYLDPTSEDFESLLPGNQMAINTANERQVLESYGMINVELQDAQGNELQITKPATMTSPVPESLQEAAPGSIPLWYFDEEDKFWKEEGAAQMINGYYIGEVNHFTWWNCDVPRDFIYLEGSIASIRASVWDHTVRLTSLSSGTIGITNVSQESSFAGFIPKDEYLLLEVLNLCSEVEYSAEIGPFEVDVTLPQIVINVQELDWIKLSGQLVDCNNNVVDNGYILLQYEGLARVIFVDAQGRFSEVFPSCFANELTYVAVDLNNSKSTAPEEINFESDMDIGQRRVCEDIGGEFSLTLNGEVIMGQPCYLTRKLQAQGWYLYDVKLVHVQESGTVIYTWYINIPQFTDPLSWISIGHQESKTIIHGNPDYVFEFDINAPIDSKILENSTIVGSTFHLVSNVDVLNTVTNEIFEDVDLDIKAIIQQ